MQNQSRKLLVFLVPILASLLPQTSTSLRVNCQDLQSNFPEYTCTDKSNNLYPDDPDFYIVTRTDSDDKFFLKIYANDERKKTIIENFENSNGGNLFIFILTFYTEEYCGVILKQNNELESGKVYRNDPKSVLNNLQIAKTFAESIDQFQVMTKAYDFRDINIDNFVIFSHSDSFRFDFFEKTGRIVPITEEKKKEYYFAYGLVLYEFSQKTKITIPSAKSIDDYDLSKPLLIKASTNLSVLTLMRDFFRYRIKPHEFEAYGPIHAKTIVDFNIDILEFDCLYYIDTDTLEVVGTHFRWMDVVNLGLFSILLCGLVTYYYADQFQAQMNRNQKLKSNRDDDVAGNDLEKKIDHAIDEKL